MGFVAPPVVKGGKGESRICEYCGKEFIPKSNPDQKYCSVECGKKHYYKKVENEKRLDITKEGMSYLLCLASWNEVAKGLDTTAYYIKKWCQKHHMSTNREDYKHFIDKSYENIYYNLISVTLTQNGTEKKFRSLNSAALYVKRERGLDTTYFYIRKQLVRVLRGERKSYHGFNCVSPMFAFEEKRLKMYTNRPENHRKASLNLYWKKYRLAKDRDRLKEKCYRMYQKYGNSIFDDYCFEEYYEPGEYENDIQLLEKNSKG